MVDPEWHLEPDQLRLQQIGHIDADEINGARTGSPSSYEKPSPLKIFTLHQFTGMSLPDRSKINFSGHPEVATLLHAVGQGSQPQKQDTWAGPDMQHNCLVNVGQNIDRVGSEAAFVRLCGVAPIPVSSSKIHRMRLHRGGDRQANRASRMIAVCRLCYDPRTIAYMHRRLAG